MFKTQVELRTGGRVISLQSFDHFDVLSIVADLFFLTITLKVSTSISVEVSQKIKRTKKRKTNCATITSLPWPVVIELFS